MKSSVPTLLVCHDLAYVHYPEHIREIHLKYYRKNFPRFHRRANHVVAVSEFTRQDVIKNYGLSQNEVSVGYNATPPGFRKLTATEIKEQKAKYTDGSPYFIYVGSLHPRKNLVRLIEAFDNFKSNTNNDHKLVLIGRFAWKNEELKDTYEKITHKSDIILTGSIHDGIHPIVAASEGLFYVSLFEGFGIPILEGFSSHVPVVTSNVSSMPEVAGDCGIVIDPTDTSQIIGAMKMLAQGKYPESELKKAAKRAATFTWKNTADHIYSKLQDIHTNHK